MASVSLTIGTRGRDLGTLLAVTYVATYVAPPGVRFHEWSDLDGGRGHLLTDHFRQACRRLRFIERVERDRPHRFTVYATDDCPDRATFERSVAVAARTALNAHGGTHVMLAPTTPTEEARHAE